MLPMGLIFLILTFVIYIITGNVFIFLLFLFISFLYTHTAQFHTIKETHHTIRLPDITKEHKIALVSDLHFDENKISYHPKLIQEVVESLMTSNPDIILFLGDFIQKDQKYALQFKWAFTSITSKIRCIAVLGNHDILDGNPPLYLENILKSMNVELLVDKLTKIDDLNVYGIHYYTSKHNLKFPKELSCEDNVLLLSHTPSVLCDNVFLKSSSNHETPKIVGVFCGHTHAGQVALPFVGCPLVLFPEWSVKWWRRMYLRLLDLKRWKYITGIHYIPFPLVITSGVGSHYGFRFNCPPDVVFLHIKPINSM
ncbi:hypothetical protein EIN_094710 [Entamoeba invadens IP1]|uniref:Calcineurin-like phosphoesterase domain-containing protein n=1 Tax=Entamoeba invadens IP1 TaxID=370355 RepID=A0A0A1U040_ENTIV|nr:hypothetical protein EIN_094710 [Entamoeba invadens IP1]ELP87244.1 hypothetical protein EIN_094710 [Entamoeba invadens IP1]|eukprot:XP_004254015.1 hypothetical protein EIN_094710 [Entamoeba invadens IP1]